eukprot:1152217-Pelagomonas_calceolata.AAC.2
MSHCMGTKGAASSWWATCESTCVCTKGGDARHLMGTKGADLQAQQAAGGPLQTQVHLHKKSRCELPSMGTKGAILRQDGPAIVHAHVIRPLQGERECDTNLVLSLSA